MAVRFIVAAQQQVEQLHATIAFGFGQQASVGDVLRRNQRADGARVLDREVGDGCYDPPYMCRIICRRQRGIPGPARQDPVNTSVGVQNRVERKFLRSTTLCVLAYKTQVGAAAVAEQPANLVDMACEVLLQFRQHVGVAGLRVR